MTEMYVNIDMFIYTTIYIHTYIHRKEENIHLKKEVSTDISKEEKG
jgi:hypothetical protein